MTFLVKDQKRPLRLTVGSWKLENRSKLCCYLWLGDERQVIHGHSSVEVQVTGRVWAQANTAHTVSLAATKLEKKKP